MSISWPIRAGVLALVGAFSLGLLWLGVVRYRAEQRAVETVQGSQNTVVPTAGGQAARESAPGAGQSSPGTQGAPGSGAAAATAKEEPQLQVHVTGAVVNPGVYRLSPGARVAEAIEAAGGSLPDGVPDALNLAAHLSDGEKIYVSFKRELEAGSQAAAAPESQGATRLPVKAEPGAGATAAAAVAGSAGAASATKGSCKATANLNTATEKQLEDLDGIGPSTAKKIIELRQKVGRIERVDDLKKASVTSANLEKIRPCVTL